MGEGVLKIRKKWRRCLWMIPKIVWLTLLATCVSLMPEEQQLSPVAEVHYLLPFRKLHFTYLADLKDDEISGLSKPN